MPALLAIALLAAFPPDDVRVEFEPRADLHDRLRQLVGVELGGLLSLYRHLHAHPEVSLKESKTAARLADELRAAGFEVTSKVGGTGVVAVLSNGSGPTVLVRGDTDALPVTEKTGVPYASRSEGVMHACGHDVHMTVLVGVARVLAKTRTSWRGTAVLIAQPAEELGKGARMMIADGLFKRFPKPSLALSLHVSNVLPAGVVGHRPGWAFANVDSVDIEVFGQGGHGARPQQARDPVVAAAAIIMALQTVVSRHAPPLEPGVVTVGSIHAGRKHNIIPDSAKLQLTVRSYTDTVRKTLLDGIREVTTHTCAAMRCTKPPKITIKDEFTPASYNHPGLDAAAAKVFTALLGATRVREVPPTMGGEDFGRYSRALGIPGLMYRLGTVPSTAFGPNGEPKGALPSLHSPLFAPDPEPTIQTGVLTLSALTIATLAQP